MKTTTLYDFTLSANGTQVVLADADFYKVLTSTGDIQVTRDGGATVKPIRAGRGERNVPFQRLILKDISGAPNSGTILVGDSDFIDDTIVISSAINVRPEAATTAFASAAALAANTGEVVFAPAANTGGAILLSANIGGYEAGVLNITLLSKASAPAGNTDGHVYLSFTAGANRDVQLPKEQYIPAGHGLYFISPVATTLQNYNTRSARYKLL